MDFSDLIDEINDNSEFEEIPVDLDTFMGEGYLEQTGVTLSYNQKEMIEHMTQIFRYETLVSIYGKARADELQKKTVREVVAMLGKGSGKDFCSEVACAYVVYKLLCLKDPARYFGKPPGDSIDIINVAINADQARNVFFKGLSRMIKHSPWFANRFHARQRDIAFDKNITVYSGHSEAEAFEGYNILMCVLDEIAGFEHFTAGEDEAGKSPAQAIYDMYNASISSRFGKNGKLVMLSFPRAKGDFIASRYEEVVAEVNSIPYSHTFIINDDFPADAPGNSFDIEWTQDEIISYREKGVWALRRPTWEVNPTKSIEDFMTDFLREPDKALGKFAAEPQESVGGLFGDHEAIDAFANYGNGVDENGVFLPTFVPKDDETTKYYIHVDLARKHDRCVVSMAHVSGWEHGHAGMGQEDFVPRVTVDLVRYWTPSRGQQVNFIEVRDFIVSIIRRGFPIGRITLDRWQSEEMINFFTRMGVKSDILSVGLPHYMDLKVMIADRRITAPHNEILRRELKQLFITKNGKNVDHPKTKEGSKDISDSVCGAAFNAAAYTPKKEAFEFKVLSIDDFRRQEVERLGSAGPIDAPRRQPSGDMARYLDLI